MFVTRQACPLCQSEQSQALLERPYSDPAIRRYLQTYYGGTVPLDRLDDGVYKLCLCRTCGSLYQAEILDEAGTQALYSQWIKTEGSFQKRHEAPLGQRIGYARQAMQIIKALNRPPHELAVLDFGMGWGTWLLMIRAFGMQAFGLELSEERQQHARTLGLEVVTPDHITPESFHFINAEQVFEHLTEPIQVLKQCHTWLKPQGFLRVAVPNGIKVVKSIQAGTWQISDTPSIPLEHINIFTPHSLAHFGKIRGFQPFHPPLALPMWGLNKAEVKQFVGVLGADIAARWGIYRTTTLWLRKL